MLVALGVAAGGAWIEFARRASRDPFRLRPPGAASESDLLARCIRCGLCIRACPVDALRPVGLEAPHAVGSPYFTARSQPCTLCAGASDMACITACPTDALHPLARREEVAIGVAAIDESRCLPFRGVLCRACWRACPYSGKAITYDPRGRPRVMPSHCVGCGLCEYACLTDPPSIVVRAFEPPGDADAPPRPAPSSADRPTSATSDMTGTP